MVVCVQNACIEYLKKKNCLFKVKFECEPEESGIENGNFLFAYFAPLINYYADATN